MSYASVASHNIPFGEMPKPDQSLADGHFAGETEAHTDVDSKINVLPAGTDPAHPPISPSTSPAPTTVKINPPASDSPHTSSVAPKPTPAPHKGEIHIPQSGAEWEAKEKKVKEKAAKGLDKAEKKGKEFEAKAKKELQEVENSLGPYWEKTKDVVLRPGTLGGLMGIANVGLLGTLGYYAYKNNYKGRQPIDWRVYTAAGAGTLALFGAEGYVADSYLHTEEGQQEAERAKREGSKMYLQAKEVVLRPGVFGGLAGFLNVAVLGTVGYFSYQNWDRPWDTRVVSAVSVGLLALSGLEGYAGKKYVDEELPKH